MREIIFVLTACLTGIHVSVAQTWKEMMHDYSYNVYEVVDEAEKYYATHTKGKGSGWMDFERWRNENERKFYPSGRRDHISPFFVEEGHRKVLSALPTQAERSSQNQWSDMGPYDADNVTSHYSQGIGRVECAFVDASNPNKIYMGSRSGGFWRTTNGGQTWMVTTDTLIATGVNTMSASFSNSDSVLINVRNARNGYSHGIFISANGGLTWKSTNFNPSNLGWGGLGKTGQVNVVAVSPLNSSLVFVGTDKGLYRSSDFLTTYTRIATGNYNQVVFHPSNPQIIYAYDRNDPNKNVVLKSINGGLAFSPGNSVSGNNDNTSVRLSVSPVCADCIYFASNNGVWKSTDGGQNFVFKSNPNETCAGFSVSDIDTQKIIYGYVDLYSSANGGQSFNQATYWSTGNASHTTTNYIHADLRYATSVNGVFYVGTDGYLAKSADGGITWSLLNNGTGIREFYRMGISQSDPNLTMAGSQDNGTSIYTTQGWIEWNGGDGMEAIVQTLNPNWMIGSWQYGNRNRTIDRGQTRNNVKHNGNPDWNAPMFFDPNHHFRVYSFAEDVYMSEDYGSNWQKLANIPAGAAHKASVAENNSNIMLITRSANLYLSTDGGATLVSLNAGLPHNSPIADVAFHPLNDSIVVMIYNTYQDNNKRVYISFNLGQSWNNISFNLSPMPARDVVLDDRGNIYIGCEIGVYTMQLGGTQWNLFSEHLPNVAVEELEIQWATQTLRAVTWGRGMWQVKLPERENHPSISHISISQTPTIIAPVEDFDQHITARVSYAGNLTKVYALWSRDVATLHNYIEMDVMSDGSFRTRTPLPAYISGTEMYFKVFAVGDATDTTYSYKFNYTYRTCTGTAAIEALSSDTLICKGDSITLLSIGAIQRQWRNGIMEGQRVSPQQTTTYHVKGWNTGTCAGADSIKIRVTEIDTTVVLANRTLVASQMNAQYQWLDCENNFAPITGATGFSYTSTMQGKFALALSLDGCTDTTDCRQIDAATGYNPLQAEGLLFMPNPTQGKVLLQSEFYPVQKVRIVHASGIELQRFQVDNRKALWFDLQEYSAGVYFIFVEMRDSTRILRIIKQ